MAETEKPASEKQVFDVAKPGKSAPSSSSRPLLISNQPEQKDPMVVDNTKATDEPANKPIVSSGKLRLEPIHADIVSERKEEKPVKKDEPPVVDETNATDVKPSAKDISDVTVPASLKNNVKNEDKTVTDELEAKKVQEREQELEALAVSRKYYLPINQVATRRNKRLLWLSLALIIVIAVIFIDLALDAKLFTIPGIKPLTHFFQ